MRQTTTNKGVALTLLAACVLFGVPYLRADDEHQTTFQPFIEHHCLSCHDARTGDGVTSSS
jgi:hypothetical protein